MTRCLCVMLLAALFAPHLLPVTSVGAHAVSHVLELAHEALERSRDRAMRAALADTGVGGEPWDLGHTHGPGTDEHHDHAHAVALTPGTLAPDLAATDPSASRTFVHTHGDGGTPHTHTGSLADLLAMTADEPGWSETGTPANGVRSLDDHMPPAAPAWRHATGEVIRSAHLPATRLTASSTPPEPPPPKA